MRAVAKVVCVVLSTALLATTSLDSRQAAAQALTMDGQSGVFFQPWANVVPAATRRWNAPTLSYHAVAAGPVAGDYFNVSLEEGFGNWLEFGFTRDNHTDGGDPTFSPLFNYAGMNIFNVKAKLIAEDMHTFKWLPAVAIGGILRTNVPYVSQTFVNKNATNGDVYGVATKLIVIETKSTLPLSGGARGTNAEVYGYGGNATTWQPRAFGAICFPLPVKLVLIAPTFEVDQEPHHLAYVTYANIPTTLVYATRVSRYPDMRWSVDIGTGHVVSSAAPGVKLKANNALAIALDYRF